MNNLFSLPSCLSSLTDKYDIMYLHPVTSLSLLVIGAVAQHVFIDNIQPAYDNLPACAEVPLSTLIRDMVSGCGDGGRMTSFSCFCTQRSTDFVEMISTEVVSHCTQSEKALASSAVSVFHSYCGLRPSNGK